MKHTIEYNGVRKTVEAKWTATVMEVADLAFGLLPAEEYAKVICHGSGKHADAVDPVAAHSVELTTRVSKSSNSDRVAAKGTV